jgi:hypothetical protein
VWRAGCAIASPYETPFRVVVERAARGRLEDAESRGPFLRLTSRGSIHEVAVSAVTSHGIALA